MMLSLFVVSLLMLGSVPTAEAQTQAQSLPLLIDLVYEFANEILPCLGPCVMDKLDYFANMSGNNQFMVCPLNAVNELMQRDLLSPNVTSERVISFIGTPEEVCPFIYRFINCTKSSPICGSELDGRICGYIEKVLRFLDCNVEGPNRLEAVNCTLRPFFPVFDGNFTQNIGTCLNEAVRQLGRVIGYEGINITIWQHVYEREAPRNFTTMCSFAENVTLDCILANYATVWGSSCSNLRNEVMRQLFGILENFNCYGNGTGIVTCLANTSLYINTSSPFGLYHGFNFVNCTINFSRTVGQIFQNSPSYLRERTLQENLKYYSQLICSPLNELIGCYSGVINQTKECRSSALPIFQNVTRPNIYYFNSLSNNDSCPRNPADIEMCRCLADYTVNKSITGECGSTAPPTTMTPMFNVTTTATIATQTTTVITATATSTTGTTTSPPTGTTVATVEFTIQNVVFTLALLDTNSPEYMELAMNVQTPIERILSAALGFLVRITNIRFREGSIIVTFEVVVPEGRTSSETATNVQNALNNAIMNNQTGFAIAPGSLQVTPTSSSGLTAAAIIGITFGAVIFVAIVLGGVVIITMRNYCEMRGARPSKVSMAPQYVMPYQLPAPQVRTAPIYNYMYGAAVKPRPFVMTKPYIEPNTGPVVIKYPRI